MALGLAIALVAGLVYVGERFGARLLARWDRVLALAEATRADTRADADAVRAERARALREATKGRVVIPEDLEAAIFAESAKFAQDEMRADILDRYALYGDWNKVRRAVGIGQMEEASG